MYKDLENGLIKALTWLLIIVFLIQGTVAAIGAILQAVFVALVHLVEWIARALFYASAAIATAVMFIGTYVVLARLIYRLIDAGSGRFPLREMEFREARRVVLGAVLGAGHGLTVAITLLCYWYSKGLLLAGTQPILSDLGLIAIDLWAGMLSGLATGTVASIIIADVLNTVSLIRDRSHTRNWQCLPLSVVFGLISSLLCFTWLNDLRLQVGLSGALLIGGWALLRVGQLGRLRNA